MRRLHILTRASLLVLFSVFAAHAGQGDWIVSLKDGSKWPNLAQQYGLQVKAALQNGRNGVYLVSLPPGLEGLISNALRADSAVAHVEQDTSVALPEVASHPQTGHTFPAVVTGGSSTPTCAPAYSGSGKLPPPSYYLNQPAVCLISLPAAQNSHGKGDGVTVAVIDTWVDYTHPVLFHSIDLGHSRSFLSSSSGIPLTQETSPMVDQETSPMVDQETSPMVDGSGTIVLNQETSPMVDQETSPMVDSGNPAYAGHGTGVTGLVHLTAPNAQIAVLEAFDATTGQGNLSSIVAAIYYAVDKAKVDVINMSFTVPNGTPNIGTLMDALQYAESQGVILAASVPDNMPGFNQTLPAAFPGVSSVACTDSADQPCSFSGVVGGVTVYAPGLYVMSTYPGNRYALYTGTSFSVGWVSGTGALLAHSLPNLPGTSEMVALDIASDSDIVHGIPRLDVSKALSK